MYIPQQGFWEKVTNSKRWHFCKPQPVSEIWPPASHSLSVTMVMKRREDVRAVFSRCKDAVIKDTASLLPAESSGRRICFFLETNKKKMSSKLIIFFSRRTLHTYSHIFSRTCCSPDFWSSLFITAHPAHRLVKGLATFPNWSFPTVPTSGSLFFSGAASHN